MSSLQRTIKYVAIAFAIVLAVSIIAGIANVAFSVMSAVSSNHSNDKDNTSLDISDSFTGVKSLDVNNSTGKLTIKTGETFKVEAENVSKDFTAKVDNDGTLEVSDNNKDFEFLWFDFNGFNSPNSKITVYIPNDFVAKEAKINTGAGSVYIGGLKSEYLYVSTGAGSISGDDITAEEVKIEGGVGSISLQDVNFADGDFNCGVGSLNIDGVLSGKNKIDCGVGSVSLDLTGDVDNYDYDFDSGIGKIHLNGEKVSDDYKTDNDAANSIKVEGGVGDVSINITE